MSLPIYQRSIDKTCQGSRGLVLEGNCFVDCPAPGNANTTKSTGSDPAHRRNRSDMMTTQYSHDRRKLLGTSAAIAVAAFFGSTGRAFATIEDVEKAISEFGGGATAEEGVITLTAPEIAENGNSVPISVAVESAMTDDDYVESVLILAVDNPTAKVATFHFTPASGKAVGSTRMRLAQTQDVVAVAKMSDGTLYKDTRNVKVTIGGCGG